MDDPVLCTCLFVTEGEVRAAITAGAASIEAVGEACEAGTGCQSCHPGICLLLDEHLAREVRAGRTPKQLKQLSLFDSLSSGKSTGSSGGGAHVRKPEKKTAGAQPESPE